MRLIKLAIISFIFLFLMVTAMSLFIPSHIRISKAINIAAEKDSVFSLIENTDRWHEWHPAFMQKNPLHEIPLITITPVKENDSEIVMKVQQLNKKSLINGWQIYQHPSGDSLTLQWYIDFHLPWYPWQKFGSLFYENTYGVMLEQGLSNIKNNLSK